MEADAYFLSAGTPKVFEPVSAANPLPVQVVEGPGAETSNIVATTTFTRQANTTPYSAGQAIGTAATPIVALQFTLAPVNGGGGTITNARLTKSTSSLTNATFRLHLFDSAPPTLTGVNDGSNYQAPNIADYASYIGYFDFVAGVTGTANSTTSAWFDGAPSQSLLTFVCASNSQVVYGVLEATGAYTPGSAEVFDFRLVSQSE